MSEILVPVDFSLCARRAAEVGSQLAQSNGAALRLLNVWSSEISLIAEGSWAEAPELRQESHDNLVKLGEDLRGLPGGAPEIRFDVAGGTIVGSIINGCHPGQTTMVVMGTNGITGLSQRLFGSVAQGVVAGAPVPVLVVPESRQLPLGSKAVLAVDFEPVPSSGEELLLSLLTKLGVSRLQLLHVGTDVTEVHLQAEEKRLSTRYQQFAPEFIHTTGLHPAAAIRLAIEGASPPLVICHRRSHQFFDRFFGGSVTESLAGAATFPLLSIPI